MKIVALQKKIKELEALISEKDKQIKELKESEVALADANVRIAELFMNLEDAQESIIDQKNEIQIQNEELSENLEELTLINEQLSIAQTLNENLHKHKIQSEVIKRAHEKVLSSIHYAQNIQKSIFPSSKTLRENFPNYFKIFYPKDLVGGDFYWSTKINNKKILVVADCTGHGVPGAFMTLIAITLLERFVCVQKITDPKEINRNIDKAIIKLLKQEKESSNRDSIDLTILVEDDKENTITISSAKRPYLKVNNNEVSQIKGDRNPVGDTTVAMKKFTNHTYDKIAGDRYYLFSDGITDQFGGPEDKKLGSKNLIKFLSSIQEKPFVQQQSDLEEFLNKWMKDQQQIDDIVFFGLELS
ncbi:PP2C family protein-serine/threonine phosphatase [Flammeovirga kamogawensis]|uniref:SpoIIE family protein phosphatase n=1 Tax=Flammeovirga kamogawensis TaxID=373891 RepID=A0ABX8GV47_9BACT|nr:SpoIIE family protein phosphatase [Flammeovirga kamogawensis]MBB6461603.1 serine phosphatase RsbU (regulator of sigma subunit) [Flammeovirga kamogawensis]QWG07468.1 SpoIIE family protein phosphatase [Flammeovirga kamogawensis]TRX69280.1 SpoIIE family protein phosphatase [Flammeovirga kamogawensis]